MTSLRIDAQTQLVGLIGWPVEHSLSPAMHNAAFDALGLNWRYIPLPVPRGQVEVAMRGLAALAFRGANVTAPHKESVMSALDDIAPDAKALGAVNTIVVGRDDDGGATLGGHNTDAQGFVGALRQGRFDPREKRAVVVGAGGAARAVVFGLIEAGSDDIVVLNRTLERAQALVSDLSRHSQFAIRNSQFTPKALVASARTADLLVNATPVGMWPNTDSSIWPDDVPVPPSLTVFDLVYNPLETKFLRQAQESGAHAIGGLGMLVKQGALAFEMWTGEEAPAEVMRTACEQTLRR